MFCSAAGGILKFYSDDSPGLKVGPTTVRSSASIFASDLQAMVNHGKTWWSSEATEATEAAKQPTMGQ